MENRPSVGGLVSGPFVPRSTFRIMERSFKLVKDDSGTRWVIGGKRQFDEETVLERATEVFWRRGFAATSVDDLVHATGLGRGSLYGAFGNKEALFIRVVDH